VTPVNESDFIDVKKEVSVFRQAKEIQIFRPKMVIPISDTLKNSMVMKVGGLMGLGGSVSTCDVIFEKNTYYPGEQVNVKVICDNSQCTTGVKSFKIKFKRKVFAAGSRLSSFAERDDMIIKSSKYLYQFKDTNTGCGPN
jgi:hypothetical protein